MKRKQPAPGERAAELLREWGLGPDAEPEALRRVLGRDPEADILVVQWLEARPEPNAAEVLLHASREHPLKSVRRAAARALYRKRQRGEAVPEPTTKPRPPAQDERSSPQTHGFLSGPEWNDSHAFWLERPTPSGSVAIAGLTDERGLLECQLLESTRRDVRRIREELLRAYPAPCVRFEPAYVDFLVHRAERQADRAGTAYSAVRARIFGDRPVPIAAEPPGKAAFADVRGNRTLLEPGDENSPWWWREISWWMPGRKDLEPFLQKLALALETPIVASEAARAERLESLFDTFVTEMFGGEQSLRRANQLFEIAWVLRDQRREEPARRAAAVAWALADGTDPRDIPFCKAFVRSLFRVQSGDASREPARRTASGLIVPPFDGPADGS